MRRVQTNGKPIRTGTGERRWRWISYATVDNIEAHTDAMSALRKAYKDEWDSIPCYAFDPAVDYNGAFRERDAVLKERHRDEYDELHGDYREKRGLPRYPTNRRIVDRRNGRL